MILNGLGFTGQSLHMFPQFFANKPLDRLIREGIKPEHMNDKVLGRALDELFELDVSKVYFELAIKVATHLKLPCDALNLDSTGFHVDGRYNSDCDLDDEDLNCIRLCKGYSRDHRPDLNQAILLLLTENRAGIPLFMKAASGNVTDKTSFKKVVSQHLKSFKAALNARYFVSDAALYVAETIQELDQQSQWFISRVPLNIKAAKELVHFVSATNDTDTGRLGTDELLRTYKSQQQVERGFRFLKNPDFLVSSLYLKKPERIEALLMVMTLCLMVYAVIQHRIRYELKKQSRTFLDMKKKPAQNPTGRSALMAFTL